MTRGGVPAPDDPLWRLHRAPKAMRDRVVEELSAQALAELGLTWEAWAHGSRRPPGGAWRTWLLMAGRGFGKTRTGAEWVHGLARANPGLRIALVAATMDDARAVMIEGETGILALSPPPERPRLAARGRRLVWPNGAEAAVFSGASPERLRGPQHHLAWCDELATWDKPDQTWDTLAMGLRLGVRPRALVTTTPKPLPLLRRIRFAPDTVVTGGSMGLNPYLPPAFVDAVTGLYGGTRLGRQELDGELIEDFEGSLWSRDLLDGCRLPAGDGLPALERVVVGVDPPASAAGTCGVVAAGVAADGTIYVLEDASVGGATPEGWARVVAAAFRRWGADRVVAEANQGGDMVTSVLRGATERLPVTPVHARRGKTARAEPVAAEYERGKIRHAGAFPELEDQLAGITAGGAYRGPEKSPDRADALVWAVTALAGGGWERPSVTLL